MIGGDHVGRREIIELDLLHQKRAGHVSMDENTELRKTHEKKKEKKRPSEDAHKEGWLGCNPCG